LESFTAFGFDEISRPHHDWISKQLSFQLVEFWCSCRNHGWFQVLWCQSCGYFEDWRFEKNMRCWSLNVDRLGFLYHPFLPYPSLLFIRHSFL